MQLNPGQFSLRWLHLLVLVVSLYLALFVAVPAAWFVLFVVAGILAFCIGYWPIASRCQWALVLATVHAVLMFVVALIEYGPGFDDMNPSIVVLMIAAYAERPVILVLERTQLFDHRDHLGIKDRLPHFIAFGTAFWFSVGLAMNGIKRLVMNKSRE